MIAELLAIAGIPAAIIILLLLAAAGGHDDHGW